MCKRHRSLLAMMTLGAILNSDYFSTPVQLFFSRRIRDPQAGGRMTGKVGRWALGALVMDDRAPGRLAAAGTAGAGDGTLNSVFRARYDFANQTTIGALVTTRNFGSSSNDVFAADARVRINASWVANGQTTGTVERQPGGARLTGSSNFVVLSRAGRQFNDYGRQVFVKTSWLFRF